MAETIFLDARFEHDYGEYAAYVTHIFAIIDGLGEEYQFHESTQTYLICRLILGSRRHIFDFFAVATKNQLKYVASISSLEYLPCLVAYTKK